MSASSLDLRRATSGFTLGHHIRRFTPRRWDGWLAAWRKETHDAIAIPVISYIKHQCYYNIYDYRRSARRRKDAPISPRSAHLSRLGIAPASQSITQEGLRDGSHDTSEATMWLREPGIRQPPIVVDNATGITVNSPDLPGSVTS